MIVFNRPEKTKRVLDAVKAVQPRRLYVAADGPRANNREDVTRCERTRGLFSNPGWPCNVYTLYQERNLGCRVGPQTAISWFLAEVEAGIILEDDCVPAPDFFPFCGELLNRYSHTTQVMMIGGHNGLGEWRSEGKSYIFSRTSPIWGWATWRRAWEEYDFSMAGWTDALVRRRVSTMMPRAEFLATARRLDSVCEGRLDAWDLGWALTMMQSSGVSAVPTRNLVANIGFDDEATHTKNRLAQTTKLPTYELDFPLAHPDEVVPSDEFDRALFRYRFPWSRRIVTALPWTIQRPVRAGLQRATGLVDRRTQ